MDKDQFFSYGYPVFSTQFVKETILFPLYYLGTLKEDHLTIYVSVYLGALYLVLLVSWVLYQYHTVLITKAFYVLMSRGVGAFNFVFLSQDCLGYSKGLWDSIQASGTFFFFFFNFCKKRHWDFCIKSMSHLDGMDILTILNLLLCEHGVSFYLFSLFSFLPAIMLCRFQCTSLLPL